MKLCIKNVHDDALKIYIETSTDELILEKDEELTIVSQFEDIEPCEIHFHRDAVVVWIPLDQSAEFFINGQLIETLHCQFFERYIKPD